MRTSSSSPSSGTPGEGWGGGNCRRFSNVSYSLLKSPHPNPTPSAFLLTCKYFGAEVLRIKEVRTWIRSRVN